MTDWGNGGWSVGDWVAMSTMMILFWGVLVAVVVWVVRRVRDDHGSTSPVEEVDGLLAERFARGEIDGDEFTRSRESLHGNGSSKLRGRS